MASAPWYSVMRHRAEGAAEVQQGGGDGAEGDEEDAPESAEVEQFADGEADHEAGLEGADPAAGLGDADGSIAEVDGVALGIGVDAEDVHHFDHEVGDETLEAEGGGGLVAFGPGDGGEEEDDGKREVGGEGPAADAAEDPQGHEDGEGGEAPVVEPVVGKFVAEQFGGEDQQGGCGGHEREQAASRRQGARCEKDPTGDGLIQASPGEEGHQGRDEPPVGVHRVVAPFVQAADDRPSPESAQEQGDGHPIPVRTKTRFWGRRSVRG
jgi:hypothetical protein